MNFPPGIGETDSIVNLDEKIGKWVGRKSFGPPQEAYAHLLRTTRAITGGKTPFPRGGGYRFKTFEEANAWETKHILNHAGTLTRPQQRNQS